MLTFAIGLLIGIQLGYWAWAVAVWSKQTLAYLSEIKRNSGREPSVVRAQTIQPVNGQGNSPNVVKPKTPRQLAIEKLKQMRANDR